MAAGLANMFYSGQTVKPLPNPETGPRGAYRFVNKHLHHVLGDWPGGDASPTFRGGQTPANEALSQFDVTGYARNRQESYPQKRRGVSKLSPWVRHGMIHLKQLWDHVADGPPEDVTAFRYELLRQEYARHWYARLGNQTKQNVYHHLPASPQKPHTWDHRMGCIDAAVDELEEEGWLVNQTRMWLASHWSVRHGGRWQDGENYFFSHLLDGSRAANRLGWQWVTGAGSERSQGFSRWQVEKWAAGLCASCELAHQCPIEQWADPQEITPLEIDPLVLHDPSLEKTVGPLEWTFDGPAPEAVWLTAESLGDNDPALAASPDLPAVFVFDELLLSNLKLATKRLVFLTETLAELAAKRPVELWLGAPVDVLQHKNLAVTFTPVPGWHRRARKLSITQMHPWPWLVSPHEASVLSFSTWMKNIGRRQVVSNKPTADLVSDKPNS